MVEYALFPAVAIIGTAIFLTSVAYVCRYVSGEADRVSPKQLLLTIVLHTGVSTGVGAVLFLPATSAVSVAVWSIVLIGLTGLVSLLAVSVWTKAVFVQTVERMFLVGAAIVLLQFWPW